MGCGKGISWLVKVGLITFAQARFGNAEVIERRDVRYGQMSSVVPGPTAFGILLEIKALLYRTLYSASMPYPDLAGTSQGASYVLRCR